ncbi:MAG: 30S ribosomal protein S5 [Planctomycetota bacterium]
MSPAAQESQQLESTTVWINRTSTTVKGGRRLSFAALVVVGDRRGTVGVGYGKGRGVPAAIEKAQKIARKNLFTVTMNGGTLPHMVQGRFLSSSVRLLPAAPGTGVIAGGTVRAVLEMAGIQDCLTKCYGSTSKTNVAKAVMEGLRLLRSREEVAALRGVEIKATAIDEVLEASRLSMEAKAAASPAPAKPALEPKPEPEAEPEAKQEAAAPAESAAEAAVESEAPAEETPSAEASAEQAAPDEPASEENKTDA